MAPRVAVAVLSLAAVPAVRTVRSETSGPVLRLVWLDPSALASGSEVAARKEAATLLGRMGATVSWRLGTPGEVNRSEGVSIILVGEGPPTAGTTVLGATYRRHIVWVRLPNVRAAIGVSPSRPTLDLTPGERRQVGIALGRVIAHEVVHTVAPSLPHGTGLMSESLGLRQLTTASIPVDIKAASAFRAALAGASMPTGGEVLAADARTPDKDR